MKEVKEKWIKEFDKIFVRDDGLMDKYSYYGTDEDDLDGQPMADAIKSFIHFLLLQREAELVEKIKGLRKKTYGFGDSGDEPRNLVLSDVLAIIKANEKKG